MSRGRRPVGPAKVGRRDPSLLVQTEAPSEGGDVIVVGRRPLRVSGVMLPVGTEIPGAESWVRIEAWVNSRAVRRARKGDGSYTPIEEFVDTIVAAAEAALEADEPAQEPSQTQE